MFEVTQTPFHTPAISRLWDKVLQLILSILELEGTHEGCGTLLLLKLVGMIVVLCGMFLKPPFHNCLCQRESSVSVNIPL